MFSVLWSCKYQSVLIYSSILFLQVRKLKRQAGFEPSKEGRYIASIDLGSHTARFLIAELYKPPFLFRPVVRERLYTNLAKGFSSEGSGYFDAGAIDRAINAVDDFSEMAKKYKAGIITGAATGIFRRAENGDDLLKKIKDRTGIEINIVSGEEEALLTVQGIVHALNLTGYPDLFFDLGGSTTEIICNKGDNKDVFSVPVGAFVLTERYLRNDPPLEQEINKIKQYVKKNLNSNAATFSNTAGNLKLVASGGTVTSLASMVMNLEEIDVTPERINGAVLSLDQIKSIYNHLKPLTFQERVRVKGIDNGRAKVILAGTIAVISIMEFFHSACLTISYSDILEGLIISYLKGVKDE